MLRHLILALPLLFAGWIATLALVLRLGGEAPGVFVPFPPARLIANLPEGAAITSTSRFSLSLQSDRPRLVIDVYAAGAWLVLPAGLESCIPDQLRESRPSR
jgi:hypothetical protein